MQAAAYGTPGTNWRVVERGPVGTVYADGPARLVVYKNLELQGSIPVDVALAALDMHPPGASVCGYGGGASLARLVSSVKKCPCHDFAPTVKVRKYVARGHGRDDGGGLRRGRPNPGRRQRVLHGALRDQGEKLRLREDRAARFVVPGHAA